jgi:hypothetical protein
LARELATADQAIDQAVQRLLDVLEGAQKGTLSLHTEEWVQRIKQLRAQVKQLQPAPGNPSSTRMSMTKESP